MHCNENPVAVIIICSCLVEFLVIFLRVFGSQQGVHRGTFLDKAFQTTDIQFTVYKKLGNKNASKSTVKKVLTKGIKLANIFQCMIQFIVQILDKNNMALQNMYPNIYC